MPELPEVETIRRDLERLIVGKSILDIEADSAKQVKPSLAVVKKAIVGVTIKKVERRAKLLLIHLTSGQTLGIHLKLTGRLLVRKQSDKKDEWQRVTISLSGERQLRLADLRKFGWLKLIENPRELEKILSEFGPEPFGSAQGKPSDKLTLSKFGEILSNSKRPIKIILMDQKKISGIGNIYASDALLLAKIHPNRPANSLNSAEQTKLLGAVERVLKAGIRYRGASDQYYLDALGHKGEYQEHFLAYGQQGKLCKRCKKAKIVKVTLGGRGTYFCPECQK